MEKAWFESWFDSRYYHILYKNHDTREARAFIDELLAFLQPPPGARMLDLACGKGRFSSYIAEKHFEVTGLDLSEQSIEFARLQEQPNLTFYRHDMRYPFRINYYDYVFNFFTSFGYFDRDDDNLRTLQSIYKGLKTKGIFVLDYFNSDKVVRTLVAEEKKTVDGIDFHIRRSVAARFVFKDIRFEDNGREYHFTERVQLFDRKDLEDLLRRAGLEPLHAFGDYHLLPFDAANSPRLILIAQKP